MTVTDGRLGGWPRCITLGQTTQKTLFPAVLSVSSHVFIVVEICLSAVASGLQPLCHSILTSSSCCTVTHWSSIGSVKVELHVFATLLERLHCVIGITG
jgi:hypothetical protein